MKKIGMGLVGPGFIAAHHIDAVRRLGDVEVIAIAGSSAASTQRKAAELKVDTAYGSFEELIADSRIEVVHNTTPSYLHFPVSMAAIQAGKHVISDKPLALTSQECAALRDAAEAAGIVNAVTFNYRGNPLVQQARQMVAAGELGPIVYLHGQYLQDWLTDDHAYSWRLDPAKGGVSSALADIGSHWCDLTEHISGLRIESVLADLTTVVKTRYAGGSSEAFSKASSGEAKAIEIGSEDTGSVLLRFSDGARGTLKVGQVLPGHKNDLQLELNGRRKSLRWEQELQNELWIGSFDGPNCVLMKDPALMSGEAKSYAHLPGGHQESWADAFRNVIADAYDWVRAGADPAAKAPTVCDFANGHRVCCIIEAMLRSNAAGGVWTSVGESVTA
ncbi:Nucleoside-diphosphate-sugar epimerase [Acidisarcina polymorpha]|uniref:Nucleoside-diphosphate-sugar epimerase n=1 Tax=Acidisarcina polymorpha TaxID=2211140 RepID=A0A2Z5FU87_9BACT|nr:Gfo/Idh/MocA family oxidoreductase [Acidisarcina polymorpha]AXC10408.1 Nucleoside-diphosphate-sugar epimerase [Acidisarcina polymorpha]